jgi:signal transduction histidine kinase
MNTVLAGYVSARIFQNWTGVPIQAVRTIFTIMISVSMFKVTIFLERERQNIVEQAQLARLQILEQQENMRRELLKHTVETQEEERSRIARELHDEMAQTLTAFSLDLATLQQSLPRNSKATHLFQRLQNLGKEMSQSIYRMVHDLRPAHLDDLGLIPALQYLFNEDFSPRGLRITFETIGTPCRAEPLVETVIFRIAQEALTNTLRHASVDSAFVYLEYGESQTTFKVQDHGCGFISDETFSPPRGWGLAGMRERVESVGGAFKIESELGKGTLVQAVIPC